MEEANVVEPVSPAPKPRALSPAFGRIGWLGEPLIKMLEGRADLLSEVFFLPASRIHLIALVFAHIGDPPPTLADLLIKGSLKDVLAVTLGYQPKGIRRVLDKMQIYVLDRENYVHLMEILSDPAGAKIIFHAEDITDPLVKALRRLPTPLYRIAVKSVGNIILEDFPDGLRILAARSGFSDFDAFVRDLSSCRQPRQFAARLRDLVDRLPLPESLPPSQIGHARRLDNPAQIREIARRWRNCLADYISNVNDGDVCLYLTQRPEVPAVCMVRRRGRLGWFLDDALGPENNHLPPDAQQRIQSAFEAAGMPHGNSIYSIETLIRPELAPMRPPRRRRRRHVANADIPD